MLIKINEHLNRTEAMRKTYKGIVVANEDVRKLGRIKCTIAGMLESDDPATLPWMFPKNPPGIGGSQDSGWFGVPRVGSQLIIESPFNDIYSCFYTGTWQNSNTHQGAFNLDYPDSYGFTDPQGTTFLVSLARRLAEFQHISGAAIGMDKDGVVSVTSPTVIRFQSADRKTQLDFNMETGEVKFNPKDSTELSGNKTEITSSQYFLKSPEVREDIDGSRETKIAGGQTTTVGGSSSYAALNNHQVAYGGNYTELITQLCNRTYGLGISDTIVAGGHSRLTLLGNISDTVTLGNYLVSLLAGLYSLTASLGVNITTPLAVNITATTLNEIVSALTQTIAAAYTLTAGAAVNISAGAAMNLTSTGPATLMGATTLLGLGLAPVVTILSDPIEDFITGKPKIGVPTVLAG